MKLEVILDHRLGRPIQHRPRCPTPPDTELGSPVPGQNPCCSLLSIDWHPDIFLGTRDNVEWVFSIIAKWLPLVYRWFWAPCFSQHTFDTLESLLLRSLVVKLSSRGEFEVFRPVYLGWQTKNVDFGQNRVRYAMEWPFFDKTWSGSPQTLSEWCLGCTCS